jgi:hypothetical protein
MMKLQRWPFYFFSYITCKACKQKQYVLLQICNNIVYLQIMSIILIMVLIFVENILDFMIQFLLL